MTKLIKNCESYNCIFRLRGNSPEGYLCSSHFSFIYDKKRMSLQGKSQTYKMILCFPVLTLRVTISKVMSLSWKKEKLFLAGE